MAESKVVKCAKMYSSKNGVPLSWPRQASVKLGFQQMTSNWAALCAIADVGMDHERRGEPIVCWVATENTKAET